MSKIEFYQLSEEEVEVFLPPDTPMEMVEQVRKSFMSRGLVEDLAKSTVNVRYYFRPQDEVNKLADELIKSLKSLAKEDDELPYWHPEAKRRWKRQNEVKDALNQLQSKRPKPASYTVPNTPTVTNTVPKKIFDPQMSGKVNYAKKTESSVEKSGYGPKRGGQYDVADNARRKARNTGEIAGEGPNVNVKSYSTKPGQSSMKESASQLTRRQAALNRKSPVKVFSQEEKDALAIKMGLKKGWGEHLPFPSVEENLQQQEAQKTENLLAQQLANLMNNKSMLGNPTSEEMIAAGERMGLGVSEKVAKAQEQQWGNAINSWLQEATKPISQRFTSEEEELAYWNNIKVNGDSDDGKSGY